MHCRATHLLGSFNLSNRLRTTKIIKEQHKEELLNAIEVAL